jgi:two-component system phosphate regulon response regulator PhoB
MRPARLLLLSERTLPAETLESMRVAGLEVQQRTTVLAALDTAVRTTPDIILVDYQTYSGVTFELCRTVRQTNETRAIPLIVFAGGDDGERCMAALEAGADDWLADSLSSRESLLRIRAKVRHLEFGQAAQTLVYADLELDIQRFKARRGGTAVALRAMEMKLLRHLMENPSTVFSRRQLLENVWMNTGLDEGAVTATVRRLRRTLGLLGGADLIRTVPNFGYTLDADFV